MGFAAATTDATEAIERLPPASLVIVSTAHDSHASLAAAALDAGHWVFLEKPAVVTSSDLRLLVDSASRAPDRLELGYNRRYNPMVRKAREALARETGPTTIACTVREVDLEPDHWYLWPNQGTRITGNLCHWIDLAIHLIGARAVPVSVSLSPAVGADARADEERTISVVFDDGSVAAITATNRGDDVRGVQEWIEARRGGVTARIDDLWKLTLLRDGTARTSRTPFRSKSHQAMYQEALGELESKGFGRHPLRDMVVESLVQIAASEMVASGEPTRDLRDSVAEWLGPPRSHAEERA
jgi:predicted dehydrogenase